MSEANVLYLDRQETVGQHRLSASIRIKLLAFLLTSSALAVACMAELERLERLDKPQSPAEAVPPAPGADQ